MRGSWLSLTVLKKIFPYLKNDKGERGQDIRTFECKNMMCQMRS